MVDKMAANSLVFLRLRGDQLSSSWKWADLRDFLDQYHVAGTTGLLIRGHERLTPQSECFHRGSLTLWRSPGEVRWSWGEGERECILSSPVGPALRHCRRASEAPRRHTEQSKLSSNPICDCKMNHCYVFIHHHVVGLYSTGYQVNCLTSLGINFQSIKEVREPNIFQGCLCCVNFPWLRRQQISLHPR